MIVAVAIVAWIALALGSLVLQAAGSAPPEVDWLTRAGLTGALATFLWGFLTDKIVSGMTHRRVVEERDRLLELAIANTHVASRSVDLAAERSS